MTNFIVSNRSEFRSLKESSEDLVIVHDYETPIFTTSNQTYQEHCDIYLPETLDVPDYIKDYIGYPKVKIDVNRYDLPIHAIDQIYEKVLTQEPGEAVITVVSDFNFSKLVTTCLNRKNKETENDIGIMNMIQYFNTTDFYKMTNQFRSMLGITDIFPEDLIAFSFAVRQALIGR